MPAVTVENTLSLPAVAAAAGARVRPVRSITTAPSGFEGEGFPVRRAFAGVSHADLDPFVHLDQMGEVDYAPGEPKGTPWHPHRGFETVTYIIDGEFVHQDSHGGGGRITNGDTQWMTAGSGILHIEVPPEELVVSGGLFHGLQLWVNLPSADKMVAPRYQDLRASEVGLRPSADGGALVRVIAGSVDGRARPRHHVHADHDRPRLAAAGRRARPAVEPGLQRASSTCWPGGAPSGSATTPSSRASWPCSAPATRSASPPTRAGRPLGHARAVRAGWSADPRAGRAVRPVRDEHQGRDHARRSRTSRPAAWARSPPDPD